jgi:hypothetical protein
MGNRLAPPAGAGRHCDLAMPDATPRVVESVFSYQHIPKSIPVEFLIFPDPITLRKASYGKLLHVFFHSS